MRMETADIDYRDIWRGLFFAPSTGEYQFFISGDDYAEFNMDTTTPFNATNDTHTLTNLCNTTGWTNYQDFYKYDSQFSARINLTQGEYYYVEIKHRDSYGNDHVTVGAEIPNTEDFYPVNYVYAIHKIQIETAYVREKFYVSVYNYGEGSEMSF